jgi:hypothetical protein
VSNDAAILKVSYLFMTAMLYLCCYSGTLSSSEIYSVYRVLKYYSNVEYTQHGPHKKIYFFVWSVLFFPTARIFFATAHKN